MLCQLSYGHRNASISYHGRAAFSILPLPCDRNTRYKKAMPVYSNARKLAKSLSRLISAADRLILFLDYDGTLTPIMPRPEEAIPSRDLLALLRRIERTRGLTLAIVTGRTIRTIRRLIPLRRAWYIGTHGVEISRGAGRIRKIVDTRQARLAVRRALRELKPVLDSSFTLEDKGFSLSLHYRLAPPGRREKVCRLFLNLIQPSLRAGVLSLMRSKGAMEAKPAAAHKGLAIDALLPAGAFERTLCLAMGDDRIDEDLFRRLRRKARSGVSVAVGDRIRAADYRLRGPADSMDFLDRVRTAWESRSSRSRRPDGARRTKIGTKN